LEVKQTSGDRGRRSTARESALRVALLQAWHCKATREGFTEPASYPEWHEIGPPAGIRRKHLGLRNTGA
jgi:hypothetical protein